MKTIVVLDAVGNAETVGYVRQNITGWFGLRYIVTVEESDFDKAIELAKAERKKEMDRSKKP